MPTGLAEISDELEPGQNYAASYLAPGEVFAMTWQGGGYGDPLTRDPAAVAGDLREEKITVGAAVEVYGVVVDNGAVERRCDDRRARTPARGPPGPVRRSYLRGIVDATAGQADHLDSLGNLGRVTIAD